MPPKPATEKTTLRLRKDLKGRYKELALKDRRTFTALIEMAMELAIPELEQNSKEPGSKTKRKKPCN